MYSSRNCSGKHLASGIESDFWFPAIPSTLPTPDPFLAKLKAVLENRKFNMFSMGSNCFRQDQIDQVQDFIADLRLVVKRLHVARIPFGIDGFDQLIDNSTGLEEVYFYDCTANGRNWSLEQQTAIFNAVARLDNITYVCFNWTPLLEQSLYLDLLEMPSLRSLELKITDPTVFTLLMERMKRNTYIDALSLDLNGWPSVSPEQFKEVGQMLAENKVLRSLHLYDRLYWTNQSLAMHPMIQKNTTLTYLNISFWTYTFATLEQL